MKKRILVVEYDTQTVESIHEVLAPSAFDITVVEEGQKAREALSRQPYDLVVTAAMLPKFHGFNLSQFISEQYPQTKIIIMSGIYKEVEYKHQAITQYNADDFFEKPLNRELFKSRVLELLNIDSTNEDASASPVTMEFPIADTARVPAISDTPAQVDNSLSSDELFGDIIEQVEAEEPFEIELNPQDSPAVTAPETVPPAPKAPSPPPAREEEQVLDLTDDDLVPVESVKKPPEDKHKADSFKAITSDDIDASLNKLLTQKPKSTPDTRRFKKIEDDFSQKFEDTLSGLGLSNKKKSPKPPAPPAAKTPPARKDAPANDFRTVEIPKPQEMPAAARDASSDLGNYDILGPIARGGMAEIYKAKKKGVKGFEKILAIKKILSGYGQDDKYIEMFVDEAKIAAELTHPNIVQIYDLGKKDDYYFIAMEYVQGKDLRVILKRLNSTDSPFPEELAIFMITKVLEGLNYAHAAKDSHGRNLDIVHRDISPPNILISYGGDVKLTDFGVSKATIKVHQTLSGALKGKLLYMSPEQARAEGDIDHRSDLYSVGIILFELLTGRKLFLESSEMKVLKRVQQGQLIDPEEFGVSIDPDLKRILLKSLHHNRDERFQSASEMLSALESYLLSKYDHIPGYLHLAHFMNDLFTEDISRDGIKLTLKPLPYEIRRLPGSPAQTKDKGVTEPPAESGGLEEIRFEPTEPEAISPLMEPGSESVIQLPSSPPAEGISVVDEEPAIEIETLDEPIGEPLEEPLTPPVEKPEPDVNETTEPPPLPVEPEESPATFEIELEEPPETEKVPEENIRIDDELASIDRKSGRRNRAFMFILLGLAAVAIGVVWVQMNRTGTPPPPPSRTLTSITQTESVPAKANETETDVAPVTQDNTSPADATVTGADPAEKKVDPEPTPENTESKAIAQNPSEGKGKPAIKPPAGRPATEARSTAVQTPVGTKNQPKPLENRKTTSSDPVEKKSTETVSKTVPENSSPPTEEPDTQTQSETPVQETPPPPPPKKEVVTEGQIATSVDTMPVAVSTPYPKLKSKLLRRLKKDVTVVISFLVSHKGNVERIKFIRRSGHSDIDMQIASTISGWTYRPAMKDNVKVKIWQTKSLTIKK